ncbi:MAG TPA: glycosyltransferase family 2 protein [Armatimonadetes bacterium]|nr:glycosyltransferase family 2 protein [Armatimonadota bacterium]
MSTQRVKTISVVIPTYNVEPIIRRCLDALTWADEVIVVDMFSTDRTREICESYPNVRFFQRRDYIYGNVNYGIEQARGDWIMRLDSDEVVTSELAREIQEKVLAREEDENDAYIVPSRVFYFGHRIRHAVVADVKSGYHWRTILFKRGTARYPVRTEHEDFTFTGRRKGRLTQVYDHYTCSTVEDWLHKVNYYTERDAERADLSQVHLTWRTRLKVALSPLVGFFRLYFLRGGWRDGIWGLMVCLLNAQYYLIEQLKLWERKLRGTSPGR